MSAELRRIQERIKKQEERLKALKEQKRKAESKKRARERERQRKIETRKKILIGACYLNIAKRSEENKRKILSALDKYLTSEKDRELFNLPKNSPNS